MRLSENFPLLELLRTSYSFDNTPTELHKTKLLYLCQFVLQPIRDEFGRVDIGSGYRSYDVNNATGGAKTSQHAKGEAADFQAADADLWEVYLWCLDNLTFGQCIYEKARGKVWIHISLPRLDKPNQQALLFKDGIYTNYEE
ncbi:peptidase M15 [Candidatus Pacearchaeota archaeon]|nr:peptidase M15 [Candidatus Pacearchaeota archaeon]